MLFLVSPRGSRAPSSPGECVFLTADRWDDYNYRTLYDLTYAGLDGERHEIGGVKIAHFGMGSERGRPELPEQFEVLPEGYFSLGQDESYYSRLNGLGADTRESVLAALNDLASDRGLFEQARLEEVVGISLL